MAKYTTNPIIKVPTICVAIFVSLALQRLFNILNKSAENPKIGLPIINLINEQNFQRRKCHYFFVNYCFGAPRSSPKILKKYTEI